MKQGALIFDERTDCYGIRFDRTHLWWVCRHTTAACTVDSASERGQLGRLEMIVFHDAGLNPGVHGELIAHHSPTRYRAVGPFFVNLSLPKAERFDNGVLTGESALLRHLPKAGIERLG